jgi:hypothetical protein
VTTEPVYEIVVVREFTSHEPEQRAWFFYCYQPDCGGARHGPYPYRSTAHAEARKHAPGHAGDAGRIHDHDQP